MDIFQNQDPTGQIRSFSPQDNASIINLRPQKPWIDDNERLSFTERFFGNTVGTFKKIVSLIMVLMAIAVLLILSRPFFKFILEISDWAYDLADKIY